MTNDELCSTNRDDEAQCIFIEQQGETEKFSLACSIENEKLSTINNTSSSKMCSNG